MQNILLWGQQRHLQERLPAPWKLNTVGRSGPTGKNAFPVERNSTFSCAFGFLINSGTKVEFS
jgi:hypothetical protein